MPVVVCAVNHAVHVCQIQVLAGKQQLERCVLRKQFVAVHPRAQGIVIQCDFVVDALVFVEDGDHAVRREGNIARVGKSKRDVPALAAAEIIRRFQIVDGRQRRNGDDSGGLRQHAQQQRQAHNAQCKNRKYIKFLFGGG